MERGEGEWIDNYVRGRAEDNKWNRSAWWLHIEIQHTVIAANSQETRPACRASPEVYEPKSIAILKAFLPQSRVLVSFSRWIALGNLI